MTTSLTTGTVAAGTDRQQWADVAKGACIVLVVLWHVTRKDYLQLDWDVRLPVTGAWGQLSESLLPVRMPLFFLVSGLFATRLLDRPWPHVWRQRVVALLYLFVLWTLVHTVVLRLAPGFDTAVAASPRDLLVQLTVTPGNLWYLLALAAYVVVARLTRRAPHVALLAALVLSAVAYAGLVPTPGNRAGLLSNLVWFLLGTRVVALPARARDLLLPSTARTATAAVAAFAVGAAAWQLLDADRWFGVRPLLGLLGVAAGAGLARVVARGRAGGPLARLGRLTLPVYVLHLPLVALVHLGSSRLLGAGPGLGRSAVLAAAYPAVVTVLVLVVCLGLHRLALRWGASWLFVAPLSRRERPTPAPDPQAVSGPGPAGRGRPRGARRWRRP